MTEGPGTATTRPPRRRFALAGPLAGLALVLAACGGTSTLPSDGATSGASGSERSAAPTATATPTGSSSLALPSSSTGAASPAPGTSGPADPGATAAVPIDPALLAILPAEVGGIPLAAVPDPAGTTDPGLVGSVARMAQAYVVDPSTSDFAYASVIVLKPGVLDDGYYRSWRDSFDAGACSQAGGVSGRAETSIGGRTVAIGRCAGGVVTYHVRLDGRDTIISVSSLGDGRLGEQIVAGLRP